MTLRVKCSWTVFGDQLLITGDSEELGKWDLNKAVKLQTTSQTYPSWRSSDSLVLQNNSKYKYVVCDENGIERYIDNEVRIFKKNQEEENLDPQEPISYVDSFRSQGLHKLCDMENEGIKKLISQRARCLVVAMQLPLILSRTPTRDTIDYRLLKRVNQKKYNQRKNRWQSESTTKKNEANSILNSTNSKPQNYGIQTEFGTYYMRPSRSSYLSSLLQLQLNPSNEDYKGYSYRRLVPETVFFGTCGLHIGSTKEQAVINSIYTAVNCVPVFPETVDFQRYIDFCNSTLWNIFHNSFFTVPTILPNAEASNDDIIGLQDGYDPVSQNNGSSNKYSTEKLGINREFTRFNNGLAQKELCNNLINHIYQNERSAVCSLSSMSCSDSIEENVDSSLQNKEQKKKISFGIEQKNSKNIIEQSSEESMELLDDKSKIHLENHKNIRNNGLHRNYLEKPKYNDTKLRNEKSFFDLNKSCDSSGGDIYKKTNNHNSTETHENINFSNNSRRRKINISRKNSENLELSDRLSCCINISQNKKKTTSPINKSIIKEIYSENDLVTSAKLKANDKLSFKNNKILSSEKVEVKNIVSDRTNSSYSAIMYDKKYKNTSPREVFTETYDRNSLVIDISTPKIKLFCNDLSTYNTIKKFVAASRIVRFCIKSDSFFVSGQNYKKEVFSDIASLVFKINRDSIFINEFIKIVGDLTLNREHLFPDIFKKDLEFLKRDNELYNVRETSEKPFFQIESTQLCLNNELEFGLVVQSTDISKTKAKQSELKYFKNSLKFDVIYSPSKLINYLEKNDFIIDKICDRLVSPINLKKATISINENNFFLNLGRTKFSTYRSYEDTSIKTRQDNNKTKNSICIEKIIKDTDPLLNIYAPCWYDSQGYTSYKEVCRTFGEVVVQHCGEDDMVWIHDFHLLLTPQYIARKYRKANISIFLHTPFPSSDIFKCLPCNQELLLGMLCADTIGFQFYDYARHFLTACHRLVGLQHRFEPGGGIVLLPVGKKVKIRICHSSINIHDYLNFKQSDYVKSLVLEYEKLGSFIFASIDRCNRLSGMVLKMKAFRFLLKIEILESIHKILDNAVKNQPYHVNWIRHFASNLLNQIYSYKQPFPYIKTKIPFNKRGAFLWIVFKYTSDKDQCMTTKKHIGNNNLYKCKAHSIRIKKLQITKKVLRLTRTLPHSAKILLRILFVFAHKTGGQQTNFLRSALRPILQVGSINTSCDIISGAYYRNITRIKNNKTTSNEIFLLGRAKQGILWLWANTPPECSTDNTLKIHFQKDDQDIDITSDGFPGTQALQAKIQYLSVLSKKAVLHSELPKPNISPSWNSVLIQYATPCHEEIGGSCFAHELIHACETTREGIINDAKDLCKVFNLPWNKTNPPLHVYIRSLDAEQCIALYRSANVLLDTSIRNGLNLAPMEYIISQDENKPGYIILSEFSGISRVLQGCAVVNPWNRMQLVDAMLESRSLSLNKLCNLYKLNYEYIIRNSIQEWTTTIINETVLCRKKDKKNYIGLGFGTSYRFLELDQGFSKLRLDKLCSAYRYAKRRVIFLDYEGSLAPDRRDMEIDLQSASHCPMTGAAPIKLELLQSLKELCSDKKNIVVVVSGRDASVLTERFKDVDNLLLAPEQGFFLYYPQYEFGYQSERNEKSSEIYDHNEFKNVNSSIVEISDKSVHSLDNKNIISSKQSENMMPNVSFSNGISETLDVEKNKSPLQNPDGMLGGET